MRCDNFVLLRIFLIKNLIFLKVKDFFNTYILPSGVILTFVATCINIYYTRQNSKKGKYIDTITSERIKWLSIIRTDISDLIAVISETLIFYKYEIDQIESQNPDESYIADTNYKYQLHYFDSITKNSLKFKEQVEYETIVKKLYILQLRFNPIEDSGTLNLIRFFIDFYKSEYKSKSDIEEANKVINDLVIDIQSLLKKEWEKVKRESKGQLS